MPASGGTQSKEHVASMTVLVDGAQLDPKYGDLLSEVKVVDSLTLPDMALVRITDLKGENIDANPLKLGAKIEIKAGDMGANTTTTIFKGQIAAVEPEFTPQGVVISARAYDEAHKLNRQKKSRTFQQMSASDMARKVVGEAGLAVGEIKSTSVVHEFFQQSNETDWDFLWRLALMHDYEVVVTDAQAQLPPRERLRGQRGGPALGREPADVPPAHERHPAGRQGRGPRLGPEGQEGRQRQRQQPDDDVEAGRPAQRRRQGPRRRHHRRHRPRRDHQRRGQRDRQVDAAADGRRLLRGRRRRASATRPSRPAARSRSRASAPSSAASSRSPRARTPTTATAATRRSSRSPAAAPGRSPS